MKQTLTEVGWILRDATDHLANREGSKRTLGVDDLDWWAFPQSWSSTSLGFGGIGGQAITSAQTVVVQGPQFDCCVYFGKRLAYHIPRPSDHFWECLRKWRMPYVKDQESLHQPPEEAVAKELMGDEGRDES